MSALVGPHAVCKLLACYTMIGLRFAVGNLNSQRPLPHSLRVPRANLCFVIIVTLLPFLGAAEISIAKNLTPSEIELLQKAFLKKLGMKKQPEPELPALPIPSYVWDIYNDMPYQEVDWVRHYYPQMISEGEDRMLMLRYNLSVSVQNATNEIVRRAVLKLKLNNGLKRRRVKVYEIDQRYPEVRRLIDSKPVEAELRKDHQWVDMDVSEALTRRRPNPFRVDLAVELSDGRLSSSPSSSAATISAMPRSRTQAAALVVYVDSIEDFTKVRRKRKAGNSKLRHQHRKHNHRNTPVGEKNLCQRRELQVDFHELNWQDWILAPPRYDAYHCQGECPIPLLPHFNGTNHAVVQGLINSVDSSLVPAPCCVPTEMQMLAILYIDVESKIIIKNYPDMQVISCGCR